MAYIFNPVCLSGNYNLIHFKHFLKSKHLNYLQKKFCGNVPSSSQVVICGSGIVGNSIAYHLTREGWKDVLILEQNKIGSGTSSYGSGVLGLFRDSSERWVTTHSQELLKSLQMDGHNIGFRKCGSINLAQSDDRAIALKRKMAFIKPSGLNCEWLDRKEIQNYHPYLQTNDLKGAVWFPEDSVADVRAVCKTLSKLAQEQGARCIEDCQIFSVEGEIDVNSHVTYPRVSTVKTSKGTVKCEYFVNAAGMWSRQVGEMSKPAVRVPAFPAEHFYLHSMPMPEAQDNLPIVRDYDGHCFCLTRNQEFILGGFELRAKPTFEYGVPANWRESLKLDTNRFLPIKNNVLKRIPILYSAQFNTLIYAPDNFTPDGKWILGETPEIDNYFVAVGMNGNSLQGGCGAGRAIAEWIIDGSPSSEMLPFDVRRFLDLHNNRKYLKERTQEVVGRHYAIEYPYQSEYSYARRLRCSPIYVELEAQGAVFGSRMGFERPLYFDLSHKRGDPPAQMPPGTFGKPAFMDCIREEYHACREGVGIMDLSSFTKIEIKSAGFDKEKDFEARESKSAGNQVVEYMQLLCSNDVNVPVGGIVHTGMHNDRGGYENDCLLIRTAENSYMMLAPTIQQTRIMDWMHRHITAEMCVSVSDITSMYTVLSIVGPKSRDMLSMLCNTDLTFHGHRSKVINMAYASDVLILAFTHTAEAGYTMVIPSEYTLHIYNRLQQVGHNYGLKNVGMMTLRALRVEKFIPFWAEELDSTKDYFIGKFALMQEEKRGCRRRLVHFLLGDEFDSETDLWPWGSEPIYRNGVHVGEVTSTTFGFTLGRMVCLGWVRHPEGKVVTNEFITKDANYEIDISGKRFGLINASLQPPKMPIAKMDGVASSYRPKVRGIVTHKF
ncbi:Pyruvate dehydrogenase phosphatase regulatory subunit, mitochondrial [Armadillidium nasatum]|uniref:Pyruvate dehydrogenase phosphatase regulatory subunit, mitochondrial n=1 Tax=Armadillidium nasatum TaxID=96803 RepID=A0A5N5TBM4_9CRUS|nr:Pyruvate dehydrogenase phosphatase regulatory subunit, mitochondrial [Armadillidium nasatum]